MTHIIYDGNSLLDGKPIEVIAIHKSINYKTGNMLQTFIICKDTDPITASRRGEDYSICGNCVHRGVPNFQKNSGGADKRSCYVMLLGVLSVYKAYKKGNYTLAQGHDTIAELGADREVRLGTYGDPSAVPSYVWDSLLSKSSGRTGYTHQHGVQGADIRTDLCMVSADTREQAEYHWSLGHRTFRVGKSIRDMVKGKEILCPASEEAGRRTNCKKCQLCSGNTINAKNIFIPAHGTGKNNYQTVN